MHRSDKTRREFLSRMMVPAGLLVTRAGAAANNGGDDVRLDAPADITLRIAPVQVEIASGRIINTVGYNGTVPGPLVPFREGVTATVDVFNDTATPELVD